MVISAARRKDRMARLEWNVSGVLYLPTMCNSAATDRRGSIRTNPARLRSLVPEAPTFLIGAFVCVRYRPNEPTGRHDVGRIRRVRIGGRAVVLRVSRAWE